MMGDKKADSANACPNCGYCPHCGRSNVPAIRWYPAYPTFPYPSWYQQTPAPTITYTVTSSGSSSPNSAAYSLS